MLLPSLPRRSIYLRKLLRRSLVLWLLARFTFFALGAGASALGGTDVGVSLALPWIVILLLALTVAALAQVDARVVREPIFHANLGTPLNRAGVVAGVCVIVMEGIIAIVAGVT